MPFFTSTHYNSLSGKFSQIAKQKLDEINTQIQIEVFTLGELVVNITEHELVPKHILLTQDEKNSDLHLQPEQHKIDIIDHPVLDANFYQSKVGISGKVNCIKNCDKAITSGDKKAATESLKDVQKNIDKAVSKGFIKANTAAREKSRLNEKVKNMK